MLEWIISSTALILIVIALRFILKGKISLRLQYALWALVLLRLIIPVSFGSAAISVENLTQKAVETEAGQVVSALSDTEIPSKTYQAAYDEVAKEYEEKGVDISEIPYEEFSETIDYEIMARMNGSRSIRDTIQIVWVVGIATVGLVLIASNIRFVVKLRKSRQRLDGQSAALPVYVSPDVDTPCLFGIFHPAIYLTPEAAADDIIRRHSIQHELTHFRHGDHFWSLLRGVCLALHWYNPLVWRATVLSRNDAELACDEATIRRIGETERAEYGRTLIEMTCQKRPALLLTATTMTGSKSSIRERITMIAKKPKTAIYTLVAVILIVVVAVGCTFMGAKQGLNAPEPFGHSYRVSAVIYDAPQFDFTLTAETAPGYLFTNDYAMFYTTWAAQDTDYWQQQIHGAFEEVKLSPLIFDDYFKAVDGVSGWQDTPYGPEKIRLDTKRAWRVDVKDDENGVFYYFILTRSGEVYLTFGYDVGEKYASAEDGSLIRWMFRLERTDFITCQAVSENCNASIGPAYYPNGFDWDYDSLPSGPINDKGTLIFTADYDMDTLTVEEDYYRKDGTDSTFIDRNIYELNRNADGKFELQVERKGETQEYACYFVKGETGVYVFKIIFNSSIVPAEEAFMLPESAIGEAFDQATLEHFNKDIPDGNICVTSHKILDIAVDEQVNIITVYAWVLYERYEPKLEGDFVVASGGFGTSVPVALTFTIDPDKHEIVSLLEYWTPRDGSYYTDDIKSKFSKAAQHYLIQHESEFVDNLRAENQYKANEAFKKLTFTQESFDALVDKICSSPQYSSSAADYIKAHPKEYANLLQYGELGLQYIFKEFLEGGQTGLRGHILVSACRDISNTFGEAFIVDGDAPLTGQDWFDQFRKNAEALAKQYSREELEKYYPVSFLLLQMSDDDFMTNDPEWNISINHGCGPLYKQIGFNAQYIRTNAIDYDENNEKTIWISNDEELDAYYEQNKDKYYLGSVEKPLADQTIGFIDAIKNYDDAFFKDHDLIIVVLEEASGSNRHEVTSVDLYYSMLNRVQYFIQPNIKRIIPEAGTCDMANWHIIIEIPKEYGIDYSQLMEPKFSR